MNNALLATSRAATRALVVQAVVTLVVALAFLARSQAESIAALAGGGAVTLGAALMAWRALGGGVSGAGFALLRLLGGMALKWLVVLLALYWAFGRAGLPPLPLLAGMGAALVSPILILRSDQRLSS